MVASCDACGRTEGPWEHVISRHRTSEGEVVYTRCTCGSVAVRLAAPTHTEDTEVLARGPAEPALAPLLALGSALGPTVGSALGAHGAQGSAV